MIQTAIVILILVLTAAFVVRWLVRQFNGESGCNCKSCPMSGGKECHCCEKAAELPEIKMDE